MKGLLLSVSVLFLVGTTPSAKANLIINGSFETPIVSSPSQFQNIGPGAEPTGFGWQITSGDVDAVIQGAGFGLMAFDGLQWLDLDGFTPGSLSQSFPTVGGMTYFLHFAYANNPQAIEVGTIPAVAVETIPAVATVRVEDSGSNASLITPLQLLHSTSTVADLDWITSTTLSFIALGTNTTLSFVSNNPSTSRGGIFLDDVSVTPATVPEPGTIFLLATGCLVLFLSRTWSPIAGRGKPM